MDVATEKYNSKKGRLPGAIGCRREVDIDHTGLFRGRWQQRERVSHTRGAQTPA